MKMMRQETINKKAESIINLYKLAAIRDSYSLYDCYTRCSDNKYYAFNHNKWVAESKGCTLYGIPSYNCNFFTFVAVSPAMDIVYKATAYSTECYKLVDGKWIDNL